VLARLGEGATSIVGLADRGSAAQWRWQWLSVPRCSDAREGEKEMSAAQGSSRGFPTSTRHAVAASSQPHRVAATRQ
jgi:hypothetical protein